MKLVHRVASGDMLPPFYGVAWCEWQSNRAVCLPVPFNLLAALWRAVWVFLRHGYRRVPVSARDAYAQGLQDGRRSVPSHNGPLGRLNSIRGGRSDAPR